MGNGVVVVGTEAGTRDGRRDELGTHIQRKSGPRKVGSVCVEFQSENPYLG